MKVALIHDYLNQYGGAERVLETLLDLFPSAHVYTLLYDEQRTSSHFKGRVFKTSLIDFPMARRNHRLFIPWMPLAVRSLRISERYDLILSDSAGYAKGVPHQPESFHLSYCYTPLRYAWEIDNYFPSPVFKTLFRPSFEYLRKWDYQAAQKPVRLLAVSKYIAEKIRRYYGRTAEVVYPPVDYETFYFDPTLQPGAHTFSYYLAVGRLMHYKRFSLLIKAFLRMERNLWIVGTGPELSRIQALAAGSNKIRFFSFVSDAKLRELYNGARALLFPQEEDFGLVAAESLACGTPVIAYAQGGALESVEEGKTGLFFSEPCEAGIEDAVRQFERSAFDREEISRASRKFTRAAFSRGILQALPHELQEMYQAESSSGRAGGLRDLSVYRASLHGGPIP